MSKTTDVKWANFYIDGKILTASPPYYFYWNAAAAGTGTTHKIRATGYSYSNTVINSSEISVTVAAAKGVTITSPANGATVSGTITVTVSKTTDVKWANFYIDGKILTASPPYYFSWNASAAGAGTHIIKATAYSYSNTVINSSQISVTVASVSSGGHFYTKPPGSALPSDSTCAAAVRRSSWEPRPENYTANHKVPTSSELYNTYNASNYGGAPKTNFLRVTGNFTGTTDEILQWGGCKWGFDEDLVRAIAVQETHWIQAGAGDLTYDTSLCPPGATWISGKCAQTYGILQIKWRYNKGSWPMSRNDTAFAVDYKLAYQRACYDGKIAYLSDESSSYPSSDSGGYMLWGCVGQWYSGGWYDGNQWYIDDVKDHYYSRDWQYGF